MMVSPQLHIDSPAAPQQADVAVRERESRYLALFNRSRDGVFVLDLQGNVTDINPAGLATLGYDRSEIIGKSFANFLIEDDTASAKEDIEDLILIGHQKTPREYRLRSAGGSILILESVSVLIHEGSKPVAILGIARDITERKHQETSLREDERRHRAYTDMFLSLLEGGNFFQSGLEENLRRIVALGGRTLQIARTSVWLYNEDYTEISCLCLYDLTKDEFSNGEVLAAGTFPEYRDPHQGGGVIAAVDVRMDPRTAGIPREYFDTYDIRSLFDYPIWASGRLRALLSFEHTGAGRIWRRDEEQAIQTLATIVSNCFGAQDRQELEKSLRRKGLYQEMLNDLSLSLMKRHRIEEIFHHIVTRAASFFECEEAWLGVIDAVRGDYELTATAGHNAHLIGSRFALTQGIIGVTISSDQTVSVADYSKWEGKLDLPEFKWRRATIAVPLRYEGRVAGALGLSHYDPGKGFSPEDQTTIERLAELSSLALDNSRLYDRMKLNLAKREEVEQSLMATTDRLRKLLGGAVHAISLAVETKDPYTAGHQQRTADLARAIATEMGLSSDRRDFIRTAASIHDIGKIGVPAEILTKPSTLLEIEFALIKTHSTQGYHILKDVDFPWPVAEVIHQHHERLDGSGYPKGIHGAEILLESRILAVADVAEAISSHRPYRPTRGIEAALAELVKHRGFLYDDDVVHACLTLFRKKSYCFR